MRRTFCLSIIAIAVMLGLMVPTTAATAAEPVSPVTPIPELPSNTIRMTPTASGSWTATDWWKAVLWKAAQPGTEVATLPATGAKVAVVAKPITPAVTFTRGAAGGPLVGSFMAGFAIGQAGLVMYGAVTGDDPLDTICGSGLEGVGAILYMGMMPDCSAPAGNPNADIVAGSSTLASAGGTTFKIEKVGNLSSGWVACVKSTSSAGYATGYIRPGSTTPVFTGGTTITTNSTSAIKQFCGYPGNVGVQFTIGGVDGKHVYPDGNPAWPNLAIYKITGSGSSTVYTEVARTVQTSADPVRKPSCTIQWDDGTTTTGAGTDYHESAGIPMSVGGLGCKNAWDAKPGAGIDRLPSRIGVDSTDETGAKTQIADADAPDFDATQRKALDPLAGNGRGLVLEKVVNGAWQSCNTWEADCAGWWDTSSQGTNGDTYRCTFGGNGVALTECGPYRNTFDTQTSTPTITDPITGQPVPWSGTATNPGTIADGVTGGGACGAAWSWNPVDWVLNPLKCAFIPSRASIDGTVAGLGEAAGDVASVDALATLIAELPSSGGCEGLPFDLVFFGQSFHGAILEACDGPEAGVAVVVNGLLVLAVGTGALLAVGRYAAAVFGFVGPGGSIEQTQHRVERELERRAK